MMVIASIRDTRLIDALSAICVERLSLKIFRFEFDSTILPLITDTLPFAEQVRRALIRNRVDTSQSEAITGKRADGTPLEGHEHAHYLPTDDDGDGRLDHLTVYCPQGFDEPDVEAMRNLRTIYRRGGRPEVRMVLIEVGGVEMFVQGKDLQSTTQPRAAATGLTLETILQSRRVCHRAPNADDCATDAHEKADGAVRTSGPIFACSPRWRSVTPFSLPRFPNRGGGKPPRPRDLPEAQLVSELKTRGLPEPISIKRIEGYHIENPPSEGGTTKRLVRWHEFQTQRFKGTQGKGLTGFELEFAEPVRGPIALGFGCHFGLGLFLPVTP